MPGVITSTSVSPLLETYIVNAKATNEVGPLMRKLMWNIPLPKSRGTTVNVPKFGTFQAYQFTRGVRVDQAQDITISNTQVTPISIAVHFVLDRFAQDTAREDVLGHLGKRAGEACNRFEERDCLTLLDGFSRSVGGGGTPKVGHLMAAYSLLVGGGTSGTDEPATPPFNVVIHPHSYHAIAEDLAGLSAGGQVTSSTNVIASGNELRDDILLQYIVARLAGMTVYTTSNLIPVSGVAKGGVWNRDALIYVPFREIETRQQEDIKLDGWDVVTTRIYGRGEFEDAYGIELNFAAVGPTS